MRIFSDADPLHAAYRQADWTGTALGAPDGWAAWLRATVRLMLDTPVPMALALGPEAELLYNAPYARLFAAKHPHGLGRPLAAVWPERWAEIGPCVARAAAGASFQIEDMPVGERRFTAFFAPLRDEEGAVAGSSCTFVETTRQALAEHAVRDLNRELERRVAERTAALARSEAHLQSLFGQTAAGIAETDLDLRIIRVNGKYAEIVGRAPEALIGMRVQDIVYPDDVAHNVELFDAMMDSGQPFEIENRLRRGDGSAVWVAKVVAPIVDPATGRHVSSMAVVVDITRRKEAEARARASMERLQLATEAARLGIWSWDPAADRATWENARMYDLIGVPAGAGPLSHADFAANCLHPDDVAVYRDSIARALDTGAPFHFEGRIFRATDGALRWIEFTTLVQRDAGGGCARMIGVAADITEAKQTLEQLRSAQGRLEATLNAGEIGTWMFDLAQYKLYADANMARLHGIADADVQSGSPLAYMHAIHPDDLAAVTASLNRSRSTGAPYQAIYRVRDAAGAMRVIHARGKIEFEHGLPARLPGVVIDITQQREFEQKFREREERYSALLTSIDEGFCVIQLIFDDAGRVVDHRFLETNPAYERHTGLHDVVGKTARELVPGIGPAWNDVYAGVAATGEPVRIQRYAEPLGRWFDVFVSRAESAATDKIALVFRDITDQKRADAELRQLAADLAQANRRQNDFLATLAHELRNPLAPIRTGLDLMRLASGRPGGDNPAALAKVRGMMERQVDHLIHLVNDLLDLARIQRGKVELKPARVAVGDIVASAVETAMPSVEARRHTLAVDVPDAPLVVDADPNRLVQVLGNLLANAVKYTPEGGRIRLAVRRDGPMATIAVSDNGIGIPPDALPTLFEMFNQGRHGMAYAQGGLGIGLSLVKSLVQQHGGDVTAASPGLQQGSTFTVRLPLAGDGADAPAQPAADAGGARVRPLRILVADDNRDAAELLAESLRLQGHDVAVAYDGLAALALAKERRPDLALLDIGMPGLDGLALAAVLRADAVLADIVLVAVTGWGTEEDRARSRAAGFDRHLTKPVDLDTVHAIVANVPAHDDPS